MTEIIEVDFKPAKSEDIDEPSMRVKSRYGRDCNHGKTIVDEVLRRINCKDCNETLDPIEVLLEFAHDRERRWHARLAAVHELDRLHKEIEELKRVRRNLKAQVRRASK